MRQEQFLDVVSAAEARLRWHAALALEPLEAVPVALCEALGRVLARDVLALGDVPAFDRADVDGFAVRAEDTFGASERSPARLALAGRPVDAGHAPGRALLPGEARAVATGALPPRGADAMVMVEDTELEGEAVLLVRRPAAPGDRLSAAGSDIALGETLLRRGTLLTARETGTLAAAGIAEVECVRRPRVAVLSTGDEIVAPGTPLCVGQVHDANTTLLADAVRELGLEALPLGIVPDDEAAIRARLTEALGGSDAVLLSGGTSKGGGDLSYRVLAELARIVVHGVALKPGKPLCLAAWEGKPVAVLPGFPTSAIFTFHAFVAPVLRRLAGLPPRRTSSRRARVPRRLSSEVGRADFVLVSLVGGREGLVAFPLGSGSGSVTTFARADGFFEIPAEVESVDAGTEVEVTLLGRDLEPADLVIVGSHCTGLDLVLQPLVAEGLSVKTIAVGSRGGLEAARLAATDLAPIHLYDPATGIYNEGFVEEGMRLLSGYGRRQGLAYRAETAPLLGADGDPDDVAAALVRAARDPSLRIANRNPSSGTRALLEETLEGVPARPPGWTTVYRSHNAVAAAIRQGRADYGVSLESAARALHLCWRPLKDESYDFLVPISRWDAPGVVSFRRALEDDGVRAALRARGFSP